MQDVELIYGSYLLCKMLVFKCIYLYYLIQFQVNYFSGFFFLQQHRKQLQDDFGLSASVFFTSPVFGSSSNFPCFWNKEAVLLFLDFWKSSSEYLLSEGGGWRAFSFPVSSVVSEDVFTVVEGVKDPSSLSIGIETGALLLSIKERSIIININKFDS